jgi:hypothetical protein
MENDAQPQPQQQVRRSTRNQKSQKEEGEGGLNGGGKRAATTTPAAAVKTKKKTKKEVQQEREEHLKQEDLHKQHQPAPITPLCWEAFCQKVVPYMQPTDMVSTALVSKESYRYVYAGGDGCGVCIF